MSKHLTWKEESYKTVFSCPVFDVGERLCRSPKGNLKTFSVLEAPDWAMILPVLETERGLEFVMVKQWRHGSQEMSLEFPGGVSEPGENAEEAAAREMKEETGYTAGKIEKLGWFYPNPAIQSNKMHYFMAWDLKEPDGQNLDPDEYLEVEIVPRDHVLQNLGKAPYTHALIGTMISLYLQKASIHK